MAQTKQLEKKIPDTSGLFEKTDYKAKITEIENKMPSISGLATNAALTVVEDKIPDDKIPKKQIKTQKLPKLKGNLLVIIMANILVLQNLLRFQQKFLVQD